MPPEEENSTLNDSASGSTPQKPVDAEIDSSETEEEPNLDRRTSTVVLHDALLSEERDRPPPRPYGLLEIQNSNRAQGRGLFTRIPIASGQTIMSEYPILTCRHWRQWGGIRDIGAVWQTLPEARRLLLRSWYPALNDIGGDRLNRCQERRLRHFIRDYAFRHPDQSQALLYRMASYINHACSRCANAMYIIDGGDSGKLSLRLVRDVPRGGEILIYYNRSRLPFPCAVCNRGGTYLGLRRFVRRLRHRNSTQTPANSRAGSPVDRTGMVDDLFISQETGERDGNSKHLQRTKIVI